MADKDFCIALLDWYNKEARELPWRSNPTPYRVWVSEMMLQQTRVETVIPYFLRFMEEVPTVEALASIDEEKLLKLWQGLGYYTRALNLKKAATILVKEHQGEIPSQRGALEKLPGIGPYSAGAISSIAFQKKETLMDGNVLRVMARVMGIQADLRDRKTQDTIRKFLENRIPDNRPGDFNQGLMELGATRCLPNGQPLCHRCPLYSMCQASILGLTEEIPYKPVKKPRDIQNWTVLLLHYHEFYAIEKRKSQGLLAKMWSFPMVEGHMPIEEVVNMLEEKGYMISKIAGIGAGKHVFTHIEWHMIGYEVGIDFIPKENDFIWVNKKTMDDTYAMPKAYSVFSKQMK